jgi:hypothetical protein
VTGDVTVIQQRVLHADLAKDVGAVRFAGGREHGHAEPTGEHGDRHPDRRGAASDQDRLPGLGIETDRQEPYVQGTPPGCRVPLNSAQCREG